MTTDFTIDFIEDSPLVIDFVEDAPLEIEMYGSTDPFPFWALTDVPHSYIGQAGKVPRVKSTEDGIEFAESLTPAEFSALFDTYFALKTTDYLTEGTTNFYDKIVTLTAGNGVQITGTYPNFTITNTYVATETDPVWTEWKNANIEPGTHGFNFNSYSLAAGLYSDENPNAWLFIGEGSGNNHLYSTVQIRGYLAGKTNTVDPVYGKLYNANDDETFDWANLKFPTFTNNGFLTTSGSDGTIGVDTTEYLKIDQTIPQTTIGKFTFPNLEVTDFLSFDNVLQNVKIGYESGKYVPTSSSLSTYVGYMAGRGTFSTGAGRKNTGVGNLALYSIRTGDNNVAVGNQALEFCQTGNDNVAIGSEALNDTTSGDFNVAVGSDAMNNNTGGDNNTAIGNESLYSNTSGSYATAIGNQAFYYALGMTNSVAIGNGAGKYVADGFNPLQGSTNSVYIGYNTKGMNNFSNKEIVIGSDARGWGSQSIAIGDSTNLLTVFYGKLGVNTYATWESQMVVRSTTEECLKLVNSLTEADITNSADLNVDSSGNLNITSTSGVQTFEEIQATGNITGLNLSGTNTGDQDLSGYVPYTDATSDVDLGDYDLILTDITSNGVAYLNEVYGLVSGSAAVLAFPDNMSSSGWFDMSNNILLCHLEDNGSSITDSSGNSNTGTEQGNLVFQQAGQIDYSIEFDGSSYIEFSPIDLSGYSFSINVWAKKGTGTSMFICGGGDGSPSDSTQLQFGLSSGYVVCYFWGNDLTTTTQITDNNWHMYTLTFDGSTSDRRIYLDGVLIGNDTASSAYYGDFRFIGQRAWVDHNPWVGFIDEFALFRDQVLSPTEITNIYNNQIGGADYSDIDIFSNLNVDAQVYERGTFAEIYFHDESTAQTIATGTTYTKITAFTTDGQSSNCTADATNDKITITKTGRYKVEATISCKAGVGAINYLFSAFLDGAEQNNIHSRSYFSNANEEHTIAISGFIDVTSANIDLDLRVRHDSGSNQTLTCTYGNLNIYYLGET